MGLVVINIVVVGRIPARAHYQVLVHRLSGLVEKHNGGFLHFVLLGHWTISPC